MATAFNDALSDSQFSELLKIIHQLTGISMSTKRKSMLVSRLRGRLRANHLKDFASYLELLNTKNSEVDEFVNSVTTNKTLFYRTPRIWVHLRDVFIPNWIRENHNRAMQVWSAAASTGEEIYTAGMILEDFRLSQKNFDYRLIGTDVSERVIQIAEQGLYRGRVITMLRQAAPELLNRHMLGNEDAGYRVAPDIRSRIKFKQHNIFTPIKAEQQFDLILLRNLMIYFDRKDQEKALGHVERALRPNGILVIGESETLSQMQSNFIAAEPLIYRRRGLVSSVPHDT